MSERNLRIGSAAMNSERGPSAPARQGQERER